MLFTRNTLIATGVSLALLAAAGFQYAGQKGELAALADEQTALTTTMSTLERGIADAKVENDTATTEVITDVTGFDVSLINPDRDIAGSFLQAAFQWDNAEEYEAARAAYNEALGEDNSFTSTYMPPDIKVETEKGEISYIDHKEVRSEYQDIRVVPLSADGDDVRYAGFVTHYMYKQGEDIDNKDALKPSEAIIEFTMTGEPLTKERRVTDVKAWSGFSTTTRGER